MYLLSFLVCLLNKSTHKMPKVRLLSIFVFLLALTNWVSAESLVADCVITPHQVTEVSSPVMGVLEEVLVSKSEKVKKGQVVARLESSVEQAAVALAEARSKIRSEIEEGKVNSEFDSKRQSRIDSLFRQKTVSEDVRDEVDREAKLASVRLKQAKDLQRIRQLELQGMRARLDQKTIRAPFDGYVIDRFKNQGEYVEEQAILRIAQLDVLNVEAVLPIELFGQIKIGMLADIEINAFPNLGQPAKVVLVDSVGNAASATFGVRLELANPKNNIPAGLRCQASFY